MVNQIKERTLTSLNGLSLLEDNGGSSAEDKSDCRSLSELLLLEPRPTSAGGRCRIGGALPGREDTSESLERI